MSSMQAPDHIKRQFSDLAILETIPPKCLICGSVLSRVRALNGFDHMKIQGFAEHILMSAHEAGFTDHLFRDLSGNSFTGAAIAAVLIAIFAHAPVPHISNTDSGSANQVAMIAKVAN